MNGGPGRTGASTEAKFAKGTSEFELYMGLLAQVVSRSHAALKAESVTESIGKLSSRDRDKMMRMVKYNLDHSSENTAALRELRDLLK
ncbi:MAG: hypothetical protein AB7S36_22080 [Planctomycetota bacterium]